METALLLVLSGHAAQMRKVWSSGHPIDVSFQRMLLTSLHTPFLLSLLEKSLKLGIVGPLAGALTVVVDVPLLLVITFLG